MNNNTEKAFRAIPAALEKVTQKTIIFGEKTFSEFIDFLGKTSVIQLAMATIIGLPYHAAMIHQHRNA